MSAFRQACCYYTISVFTFKNSDLPYVILKVNFLLSRAFKELLETCADIIILILSSVYDLIDARTGVPHCLIGTIRQNLSLIYCAKSLYISRSLFNESFNCNRSIRPCNCKCLQTIYGEIRNITSLFRFHGM